MFHQVKKITLGVVLICVASVAGTEPLYSQYFMCPQHGKSSYYPFDVGNEWAGASGSFSAGATYREQDCHRGLYSQPKMAQTRVSSTVNASLFKKSREAFKVTASLTALDEKVESRFLVRVAGRTVKDETNELTLSYSKRKEFVLLQASYTHWIGPVPITFSADLTAVLSGSISLHGVPVLFRSRVDNDLNAYLNGTGRTFIGGGPLEAGAKVELRIMNTSLDNSLIAEANLSRISGSVLLRFQAARIILSAYVKYPQPCSGWKVWDWSCTKTSSKKFVDEAIGAYNRYLVRA